MNNIPSPLPAVLHFRWQQRDLPTASHDGQPPIDVRSIDFLRYATCVLGPSVVCLTQLVAADTHTAHRRSYPSWFLAQTLGMGNPSAGSSRLQRVLTRACQFGVLEIVDDEFVLRSHWMPNRSWYHMVPPPLTPHIDSCRA